MSRLAPAVLLLACVGLLPASARAFNTAEKFGQAAIQGGGGGRYFTGSLRDGYNCAVCHRGAEAPSVSINGLPEDGYLPGQTYDLEIVLPDAAVTSSVVELSDAEGQMMGSMGLSAAPGLDEVCAAIAGEEATLAAKHVDLPEGREVVAMDACGARRLRLSWTAPAEPQGAVWFHAAVVAGNGEADTNGDGVRVYSRVIPVQGGSATSAEVAAGCSAGGRSASGALVLLAIASIAARRRGRRPG